MILGPIVLLANIKELFARVVVINLPRRQDRWRQFIRDLPVGWPFGAPLRFPAIDGADVEVPVWWREGSGAWGCYLSHCKVLEDCIRDGVESVLVLEDDALFCPKFPLDVRNFLGALPSDWQLLFLGGEHIEIEQGLPVRINDWVYRPFNANRMHAYALRTQAMMERVLTHFRDTDNWIAKHHVDCHLGELQKKDSTGIYVPKQWLVYQAEGTSDICHQQLNVRAYMGAEDIVNPIVNKPIVAVLSPHGRSASLVGGVLHQLGIHMGNPEGKNIESNGWDFEARNLAHICRNMFEEPWYSEKLPFEQRVQLLKIWAASHCKTYYHCELLGAMYPTLCLMGPEMINSWNSPFFICVNESPEEMVLAISRRNPNMPIDACMSIIHQLVSSRNHFLATCSRPALQLQSNDLVENTDECISSICKYLCFEPDIVSSESAFQFVRGRSDRGNDCQIN